MPRPLATALVLALALPLTPPAGHAQPSQPAPAVDPAQAGVDRAMAYYEAADLTRAMEELTAAYALSPRPDILWAMARIHVERGECREAIDAYQRFLESDPGPNSTQIATDAIATCERSLAASATARPPQDPAPVARRPATDAPTPVDPGPAPRPHGAPWYTDRVGDALVGAGALGGVAAGLLFRAALRDNRRADEGSPGGATLTEFTRLGERAEQRRLWAGLAGAASAALVIGGIVRFTSRDRPDPLVVGATGDADGGSVTLGGRF